MVSAPGLGLGSVALKLRESGGDRAGGRQLVRVAVGQRALPGERDEAVHQRPARQRIHRGGGAGSTLSVASFLSALSAGSASSIASAFPLGSNVSVLSTGSIGSVLSIGSCGSVLSIGSVGGFGHVGDVVLETIVQALGQGA